MLRTTARILPGLIAAALGLSAALAFADPMSNEPNPGFDRGSQGQPYGGRVDDRRMQADDLLQRARRAMLENDFDAAGQLIDQADALAVQYSPLHLGDTPAKLRRELDRKMELAGRGPSRQAAPRGAAGPADPFTGRGPAPGMAADPKSAAKACIYNAREALKQGNVMGATYWYREAAKQQAAFGPNEDSPERLAADIRRAGGMMDEPGRGPRNVTPLPPAGFADQFPPSSGQPAMPAGRGPDPAAHELLLTARLALANGDVNRARQMVQQARQSGAQFTPMGDTPEKVEATLNNYANVMAQKGQRGDTEAWRRLYARSLLEQAEALIRWRELDQAERLATTVQQMRVPFSQFESRPETILGQVASLRRPTRIPSPSGVMQASGEYVVPANGTDMERRADAAVYNPYNDPTRNIQASDQQIMPPGMGPGMPPPVQPGSAMALFRDGEAALKDHNAPAALQLFRQAFGRANELDPGTARRLQDYLQMLSASERQPANPAQNVDAEVAKQQALANQMVVEVGHEIASARAQRESDAKGAQARLDQLRGKIEQAGLNQTARESLLKRVDREAEDLRKFISVNQPRLAQDQRNKDVLQANDQREKSTIEIQNKLAQKVDEFNTLMHERRFAEAEVVAKQAVELAPENPVAIQIQTEAKLIRNLARSLEARDRKADGFVAAMNSVDVASIPYDESNPLQFPEVKTWLDLTKNRAKFAKDRGRKLSPGEVEIYQKLKTPVSLSFENAPLKRVIDQLGQLAGVNIYLDPQGLIEEGVSTDTPITIDLKNEVRLESALKLILNPLRLHYVVKNEVLKITSEQLRSGETYPQVYNVADLVIPIPNFVHRSMGLEGAYSNAMAAVNPGGAGPFGGAISPVAMLAGKGGAGKGMIDPSVLANVSSNNRGGVPNSVPAGNGPGGMGGGSMADFDSLIELITTTIQPNTWDDVGGPGSVAPFEGNLSLVVTQTQEVHEEIADLLEQLRRLQDLQVTIEVRFITLNDNFFERIGVDFDFDINSRINHPGMVFGRPVGPPDPTTGIVPRDLGEHGRDPTSATVGLAGPVTNVNNLQSPLYTATLDIPFTQDSYSLAVPQFGGFDPAAGATIGFAILSEIEAFFFINAAQGDRRSNVLQAPKVTLFNGQTAQVSDTSQTPFVMSVIPVVGDFAAAQQPVIVVLNEGTFLTVQAVVSSDKRFVRLTVVPYFSQIGEVNTFTFTGETTTTTEGSQQGVQDTPNDNSKKAAKTQTHRSGTTVQLPTFSYVTVSTTVSVPDGGTILLGGIKRLSEGRSEFGVPILNKIPYINRLFKNVGIGRETQSLMMMVTPRIIIQEEEEAKLGVNVEEKP